ncbi:ATP-binding protein [Candidatus Babeliales bacterium]|nr:ATP-binding protein [Candidatus Babeliales bacterium]
MNIRRLLADSLMQAAKGFKVLAILGPRQSGKTTLAQTTFPDYTYASLEDPETLLRAQQDPRGFLHDVSQGKGVILDEFQKFPVLLSYLQGIVDETHRPGFFVLTGSQNFLMNQAITQTLAGRIAIFTLLPLSICELAQANLLKDLNQTMHVGFYPPLYLPTLTQVELWHASYIQTYLERDVRDLKLVVDLSLFQLFVRLCAGRIGQVLNVTSLANDCGISSNTANAWLGILEASYIIFLLRPHYKNFSKRLIKSPKLYFYDVGLACSLLNIAPEQLSTHYLRGGLFESMVIAELHKSFYNRSMRPSIYFWRDHVGHEVDCIIEGGLKLIPIEIKSGKTVGGDFFDGLSYWNKLADADSTNASVVYAGDQNTKGNKGNIVAWNNVDSIISYNL